MAKKLNLVDEHVKNNLLSSPIQKIQRGFFNQKNEAFQNNFTSGTKNYLNTIKLALGASIIFSANLIFSTPVYAKFNPYQKSPATLEAEYQAAVNLKTPALDEAREQENLASICLSDWAYPNSDAKPVQNNIIYKNKLDTSFNYFKTENEQLKIMYAEAINNHQANTENITYQKNLAESSTQDFLAACGMAVKDGYNTSVYKEKFSSNTAKETQYNEKFGLDSMNKKLFREMLMAFGILGVGMFGMAIVSKKVLAKTN